MYKIRKKMESYSIGTFVLVICSDELDKDYLGVLGRDSSRQMTILFDDGCCYNPTDDDNVRFIVDYYRLINL